MKFILSSAQILVTLLMVSLSASVCYATEGDDLRGECSAAAIKYVYPALASISCAPIQTRAQLDVALSAMSNSSSPAVAVKISTSIQSDVQAECAMAAMRFASPVLAAVSCLPIQTRFQLEVAVAAMVYVSPSRAVIASLPIENQYQADCAAMNISTDGPGPAVEFCSSL